MDKMKQETWLRRHRPTTRRLVQVYSALLYNAHLKGFITGEIYRGKTKAVCVPGFNCYSCPGAVGACPLGSIQNALASTGHRAGWYVLGILLLYGVILGRTVCGWLCPLGWLQELLHKIPTPKIRKSVVTRTLTWLKYILLAVFVIALPLWYGLAYDVPLPGFCKYICPAGTLEGAMGLLPTNPDFFSMLGILFTRKFVILLIIALACVFCYRSFCRFVCPLGAIYGLFNRFNIVGVKVDANRCSQCGACVRHCEMDIRRVGDHECINCGKCMEYCSQGAISIRAGRILLKGPKIPGKEPSPEERRKQKALGRTLWGIALAVLCFALLWYNMLEPAVRKTEVQPAETQAVEEEKTPEPQPAETLAVETAAEETAAEPQPAETQAAETDAEEATAAEPQPTETQAAETDAEEAAAAEPQPTETAVFEQKDAPAEPEKQWVSSAPVGYEVGQQLQDFTVECLDGSTFHLADTRGKIVYINLWATWCAACVQELPHFNALAQEKEDAVVLAIHSPFVTVDPAGYLADKEYTIPFAVDSEDERLFKIVHGSATLPQTIVLNRSGEVVYNKVGSVTKEVLEALYNEANAK